VLQEQPQILVVDDSPGVLMLLKEFFTREGYGVTTVNCGDSAMSSVKDRIPDLVLLDVKMPKMSGFEVLEHIKSVDSAVPVVLMSAYTELTSVANCLENGSITHYISKPFDLRGLSSLVTGLLKTPQIALK